MPPVEFFRVYCTQWREGAKNIGVRVQFGVARIAGGIDRRVTILFLSLLRALRGLRGESFGCGRRLLQVYLSLSVGKLFKFGPKATPGASLWKTSSQPHQRL